MCRLLLGFEEAGLLFKAVDSLVAWWLTVAFRLLNGLGTRLCVMSCESC